MSKKEMNKMTGYAYSRLVKKTGVQIANETHDLLNRLGNGSTLASWTVSILMNDGPNIVHEIGKDGYSEFLKLIKSCAKDDQLAYSAIYYGRSVYATLGKTALKKLIASGSESIKESSLPLSALSLMGVSKKSMRRCFAIFRRSDADVTDFFVGCLDLFQRDTCNKFKMADMAILYISRFCKLEPEKCYERVRGSKVFMGKKGHRAKKELLAYIGPNTLKKHSKVKS